MVMHSIKCTPPMKAGDIVYDSRWKAYRILAVRWHVEHRQWVVDAVDMADPRKTFPSIDPEGFRTKRQFFTREIAA